LDATQIGAMRLAVSGYLRYIVKLEQLDDVRLFCSSPSESPNRLQLKNEHPIPIADKDALKLQLVPAMIAHSGASDKAIRAQIAESVSLITELDFPERWSDLIDVR
jgi:exportin-2 (importin alpha re-exporter)